MDGTISLGIYDQAGKIVRVLHQNAQLNDFAIGADALVTRWDGKNDGNQDSPSGRYHARGYLVGPLKREDLGETSPPPTEFEANVVKVRLVRNPLRKAKRPVVELAIGPNSDGTYLKTSDGLPLFKISETSNVTRRGISAKGENAVSVWYDDGTSVRQLRLSNVDEMMAFDCYYRRGIGITTGSIFLKIRLILYTRSSYTSRAEPTVLGKTHSGTTLATTTSRRCGPTMA